MRNRQGKCSPRVIQETGGAHIQRIIEESRKEVREFLEKHERDYVAPRQSGSHAKQESTADEN